jgi:hypothetical protein
MKEFDFWFRGFLSGMLIGSSFTCIVLAILRG